MPDENRVFDVSKPSKVSPSPTSKPVIVGHHPVMNDPMVKEENNFGSETPQETTKIPVLMTEPASPPATVEEAITAHESAPESGLPPQEHQDEQGSPAVFSEPQESSPDHMPAPEPEAPSESVGQGPFTAMEPTQPPAAVGPESPLPAPSQPEPHIEGLHFEAPKRRHGWLKWTVLSLVTLLVGGYLLIDSGVVNAGFKMPFHLFKQKTEPASNPVPAQNQPAASAPSLPAGFKEYKLSGTNLTFAAPAAWGDPTSTTDPGYSKRSAAAQSDGTFAYLVNFSVNKDVQVAVTSAKFLPAARGTALYYDFLQWCTGSGDAQTYQSVLNFSTANKVDTPTTVTCNQGPLSGVTKIDNSTIVQSKVTDSANKVVGDIYSENLSDPLLVVFRVKDAAMTNGTDIKQLLGTVKVTSSAASSSTSQ